MTADNELRTDPFNLALPVTQDPDIALMQKSQASWIKSHMADEDDDKFALGVVPFDLEDEQEKDEYAMISKLFDFDDLRDNNPDFGLKRYRTSLYKGVIENRKRNGLGVLMYASGRVYEGEWIKKRNGRGFEIFVNGSRYIGTFHDNHACGKGVYTWANGEIYDGEWKSGRKQGFGIWKGL